MKTLLSIALAVVALNAHADQFYVDANSEAARWVSAHASDGRTPNIKAQIAEQPAAHWFTGTSGDVASTVSQYVGRAAAANAVPILVAYNIPGRDCGQYSAGGAGSSVGYRVWIATFAAAVGDREAVVVLEPDALAQMSYLAPAAQADRLALLSYATAQFKSKAPKAKVYLDIGHEAWLSPSLAAQRLQQAGVADARGFSLNVSNFYDTRSEADYGEQVRAQLADKGLSKTFVIDTSRNGNGRGATWCDPKGRKLGTHATSAPEIEGPEMLLWIKNPGVADGCAQAAGSFAPQIAYDMIFGF